MNMAVEKSHEQVYDFVVVGGGIAGVSCVEYLACLKQEATICLISSSDLVKTVRNVKKIARTLEQFDVVEKPLCALSTECSNVIVVKAAVTQFDATGHKVLTSINKEYRYRKLCICSGARPKLIAEENKHVLGLRDLQSVEYFQGRLSMAKQVIIIGNGGIALELAHDLSGCKVIWVIKDDSIGNAYLDKGAATFLLQDHGLNLCAHGENIAHQEIRTTQSSNYQPDYNTGKGEYGGALGQGWKAGMKIDQCEKNELKTNVHLEYSCEVKAILTPQEYSRLSKHSGTSCCENDWNVYVELANGKTHGCDFVVSATGVVPNTEPFVKFAKFKVSADGGLEVDDHMKTNICDVYAAGDVCNAAWEHSEYWMQIRLWRQANQMGAYAAKCMIADVTGNEIVMDFCFELFAHVTHFFGYKVILLGKYNGQGLGKDFEVLLRCTKGKEYVKIIVHQGKVHGALLIGETDLEETFENLILNQMDISSFGEHLLDPNVDIEDYFD